MGRNRSQWKERSYNWLILVLFWKRRMKYPIIIWNCKEAAKAGLVSTLNSYVRSYGVKITVFLEIKISENRADKVIKRPGFERSHRIEAQGFLGGIRILWREEVEVEVGRNE